jgi:hypothetical protein
LKNRENTEETSTLWGGDTSSFVSHFLMGVNDEKGNRVNSKI